MPSMAKFIYGFQHSGPRRPEDGLQQRVLCPGMEVQDPAVLRPFHVGVRVGVVDEGVHLPGLGLASQIFDDPRRYAG